MAQILAISGQYITSIAGQNRFAVTVYLHYWVNKYIKLNICQIRMSHIASEKLVCIQNINLGQPFFKFKRLGLLNI